MKTELPRNGCASEYRLRTTRSVLSIGIVVALASPNQAFGSRTGGISRTVHQGGGCCRPSSHQQHQDPQRCRAHRVGYR